MFEQALYYSVYDQEALNLRKTDWPSHGGRRHSMLDSTGKIGAVIMGGNKKRKK